MTAPAVPNPERRRRRVKRTNASERELGVDPNDEAARWIRQELERRERSRKKQEPER